MNSTAPDIDKYPVEEPTDGRGPKRRRRRPGSSLVGFSVNPRAAGAEVGYSSPMQPLRLMGIPAILHRIVPLAPFCSMITVQAGVLVLLLATCIASELVASIHLNLICAVLFPVRFYLAVAASRGSHQSDDDQSCASPFVAALASRAPPDFQRTLAEN